MRGETDDYFEISVYETREGEGRKKFKREEVDEGHEEVTFRTIELDRIR